MLDVAWVRANLDAAKEGLSAKNHAFEWERLLMLDDWRRHGISQVEAMKAEKNRDSEEIARRKRAGTDAQELIARQQEAGQQIAAMDAELVVVEEAIKEILLKTPNVPHASVPRGKDAAANTVVRAWGEPRKPAFAAKPHWELGEALDILDTARGTKVTGSDFYFLKGAGAALERALISFMLDIHTRERGYLEFFPPYVVNRATATATGQLPVHEEEMYHMARDDFFLIPTAEVPVTNYHRDEILTPDVLPLKYAAYSGCFRREAGAAGRANRGIFRVHQFSKVELVKFAHPDRSYDELERLVADAEEILKRLELPYRVVLLSTGDMTFSSAKTYDLEVWAPGSDRWLEVSSCSNFETYQARRAAIRFKEKGGKAQLVHTLNGSGLALPRTWIAILENFQQADGSITVPKALRPYLGGLERITPRARQTGS